MLKHCCLFMPPALPVDLLSALAMQASFASHGALAIVRDQQQAAPSLAAAAPTALVVVTAGQPPLPLMCAVSKALVWPSQQLGWCRRRSARTAL